MTEHSKGSQTNTPAPTPRKIARRRWLLGLVAIVLLAGIAYGAYWFFIARFYVTTDDAYVHGNRISLMPRVQGMVTGIYVDDTDYVSQGQTLVILDDSDAQLALERAKANLAQTLRQVQERYVQLEQQKAVIDQREATSAQAERDFERARTLYAKRSVSQEYYQQAQTERRNTQAGLQAARHQLEALQAQTQGTDPAHHPQVIAAKQQLRRAWLDLQRTEIVAPIGGHIAKRSVQIGQQVSPGSPMLSIVPLEQVWVEANFKETELTRVRIGQPVSIHADFYGDEVEYHGKVQGLSAGTGSAFELLPPQNATGNWIKVVQRLPVRVTLDPKQLEKHPLRIGLSLTASVDVHDLEGPGLVNKVDSASRYATPVYRIDPAPVNAMIESIVTENLSPGLTSADTFHGQ
ncbi:HlyD family efflux transporter periplasmic adaptor subunit [Pistricoccus aurantiacus]|uniref:HlyD family secretion protein n=1 Tax=Pistricoccus aurantiacus TaxID=1883414 RepID=UPI003635210A